jgi:hypothetical protein
VLLSAEMPTHSGGKTFVADPENVESLKFYDKKQKNYGISLKLAQELSRRNVMASLFHRGSCPHGVFSGSVIAAPYLNAFKNRLNKF